MRGVKKLLFILQTFVILITASPRHSSESGCTDGTTEGFQNDLYPNMAACGGDWSGHVENASHLCSDGWRVCTYEDSEALSSMRWEDATSLAGCYAFNAAQDGGRCRPCTDLPNQDDMAGMGSSCPHKVYGKPSCISGGVIAASCCEDTQLSKACHFRPASMSGVVCCRLPGVKPHIIVNPEEFSHVTTGVTFVLSCQAMGTPTPVVQWFKNNELLPNNISRVAVFDSGYMLISGAQPSDGGEYQCRAKNRIGEDVATSRIIVTGHGSGCADGITDGLHQFEDIQACRGEWWGHIKRSKNLCARGWRVCSSRQGHLLKLLTWSDVTSLDGCYAYNAANILNRCQRCHRGDMAGVGKECSVIRRTHKSCLSEGRIDVYKGNLDPGCAYQPGLTTGILCCRRNTQPRNSWWKPPKCIPKCQNGGKCVSDNRCRCVEGYKGAWCQNPICAQGCRIPNSYCAKPGTCQCKPGFVGEKCHRRSLQCKKKCLNGGRCFGGKCKCPKSHWGDFCQHVSQRKPLADLNRTEK